jgi:probable HAF family extracellular repeat protein
MVVPVAIALALLATSCSIPLGDLGGPSAAAYGINEAGVIVGVSELPGSVAHSDEHAFKRLPDGTVIDLGTVAGGGSSGAVRINDAGIVAGMADLWVPGPTPRTETHAVRWDAAGAITDLGAMGGVHAQVRDLDDEGRMVGWVEDSAGRSRAFIAESGATELTPLALLPGAVDSTALGMNDEGDAVGYQWVDVTPMPVRWDLETGAVTDLTSIWGPGLIADISDAGTLVGLARFPNPTGGTNAEGAILRAGDAAPVSLGAGTFALAMAINDADVVVGFRASRAFRWEASTGAVLLDPDVESYAYDLNDGGQMVGQSSGRAAIFVNLPAAP